MEKLYKYLEDIGFVKNKNGYLFLEKDRIKYTFREFKNSVGGHTFELYTKSRSKYIFNKTITSFSIKDFYYEINNLFKFETRILKINKILDKI